MALVKLEIEVKDIDTIKKIIDLLNSDTVESPQKIDGILGVHHETPPPSYTAVEITSSQTTPSIITDINGTPWNPEIHTANKTKTKAGEWRLMRNASKKPVPPMPPIPVAKTETPVSDIEPAYTYEALSDRVRTLVTSRKIKTVDVITLLKKYGVASLPLVPQKPEIIPDVMIELDLMAGTDE